MGGFCVGYACVTGAFVQGLSCTLIACPSGAVMPVACDNGIYSFSGAPVERVPALLGALQEAGCL